MSYTTTDYGTWCTQVDRFSANIQTSVFEALGSGDPNGFDIDAIVTEYRQAINDALPTRVSLVGSEFIGPAYEKDCDWDGELDIKAIVEGIDLWEIVQRHEIPEAHDRLGGV